MRRVIIRRTFLIQWALGLPWSPVVADVVPYHPLLSSYEGVTGG